VFYQSGPSSFPVNLVEEIALQPTTCGYSVEVVILVHTIPTLGNFKLNF
jgi:hypothetical protein